jgi:hypothetical protein
MRAENSLKTPCLLRVLQHVTQNNTAAHRITEHKHSCQNQSLLEGKHHIRVWRNKNFSRCYLKRKGNPEYQLFCALKCDTAYGTFPNPKTLLMNLSSLRSRSCGELHSCFKTTHVSFLNTMGRHHISTKR